MLQAIGGFIKRFTSRQYSQTTVGVLSDKPTVQPFSAKAGLASYGSWVAAAASLNANAVAANPLRLYVKERKGKEAMWPTRKVPQTRKRYLAGDRDRKPHRTVITKAAAFGDEFVEVVDHPLLKLFYTVNPWQCGFEFLHLMSVQLDLTGNAYAFMPKGRLGVPQEVWLLPPECMYVVPDSANWIKGYEYRPRFGAEAITFEPEEIAHFRLPNPRSLWYGMGGVEKMWWAINANAAAVQQDYAMYANGSRPDYAIIVKNAAPNPDAIRRYHEEVTKQLKGVDKRGKPMVMSGDVTMQPLQFPPKDMMGREDLVEEIAAAFSVPVTLLKGNDPNRANAEVGYASWREMAIAPRCRMIEDILNQNILPMFDVGEDAVLAFDDPVPGNEERDSVIADRLTKAAIVTINEVRADLGKEPIEDENADRLMFNGQPLGAAPVSPFGEMPADAETPEDEPPSDEQPDEPEPPEPDDSPTKAIDVDELAAKVAALILEKQKPAPACGCGTKHVERVSQRKMWAKASDADTPRDEDDEALRKFIESLSAVLREQAEAIVARMRAAGDSSGAILLAVQEEAMKPKWVNAIRDAAKPYVAAQVERGAAEGLRRIASPDGSIEAVFEATNPEVQRYVDRATTRIARGVNETTTIKVSTLLGTRLEEGATIDEIAKDVQVTLGVDGSRAEMIARTESARAYTQGQIEAWKQTGTVVGKRWLLAPDACEFCRAIARATNDAPVPINAPFVALGGVVDGVSGGQFVADYEDVDAAPLHPGCLLPDTPVLARGVVAAFRAFYSGPAVRLHLADGRSLAVTANHKVLTPGGFARADSLNKGDDVIDCGSLQGVLARHPDDDNRVASVSEVFKALGESRGMVSHAVPVTAEHLHGDGRFCDGNVDVVLADRLLRDGRYAALGQKFDQLPLCADWGSDTLAGLGVLDSVLVRLSLAAHGIVSGVGQSLPLVGRGVSHADVHGGGSVALLDAAALQVQDDRATAGTETLGSLLDALAGEVALNKIVDIEHFAYTGHVFDLQTESGLHIDNGIVTSNCRCDVIPVMGNSQ